MTAQTAQKQWMLQNIIDPTLGRKTRRASEGMRQQSLAMIVQPPSGWNGTTGSGFTSSGAPTVAGAAHGSGFNIFTTTGGFTWQVEALEVESQQYGLAHGFMPADMILGRLQYVDIYLESGAAYVRQTAMEWSDRFNSFGFPFIFKINNRCGIAQGYARFVPLNGKERIVPFTVWFNAVGVAGYFTRPVMWVDFNNGSANDNISTNGATRAAPLKTIGYAVNQAANSYEGALIYLCGTGNQVYDDTIDISVNPTNVYPCKLMPEPGATRDSCQVISPNSVRNNSKVRLHADKMVWQNIYVNMDCFMFLDGIYTMWVFNRCKLWDDSPTLNGPLATFGSVTVEGLYYIPPNGVLNVMVNPTFSSAYIAAFDCEIRHPVPTGFQHVVNCTMQSSWDGFYHQISDQNDPFNFCWYWNVRLQQIGWFKQRQNANPYFVVSTAGTYNAGENLTTLAVTFNNATDNSRNQDMGVVFLTGAYAGQDYITYGVAVTNTSGNQLNDDGTIQLQGDWHQVAIGDHIMMYSMSHPDAFQVVSNAAPLPLIDNIMMQGYIVIGQQVQLLFPENNVNEVGGGDITTVGTALTAASTQQMSVGNFMQLSHSPFDYAMVTAVADSTHMTLDAAFPHGNVTAAGGWGVVPCIASFVNCQIVKLGDNEEEGQFNGGALGFGQLGTTWLCATSSESTTPNCYVFRATLAMHGWHMSYSVVGQMTSGDVGWALPTQDMTGSHNTFGPDQNIPGAIPWTGSGAISTNLGQKAGTGLLTKPTVTFADANFLLAAPWDFKGVKRRVGDYVGHSAHLAV